MAKDVREFKSNSFSLLMKEKKYALETYNSLNGSNYENPEDVEIIEVDGGISLTVRNDATFIIDNLINLYEHQSTINENMPLRQLIYIASIYKDLTKYDNIYKRTLISLPAPRFVVFYNGKEACPEKAELKLSDAYIKKDREPWLELKCEIYNINPGYNDSLKKAGSALSGYMIYVEKVRKDQKEIDLKTAIEKAIDECIDENILSEFFRRCRHMIVSADALDYTHERRLELERRDALNEGISMGIERGISRGEDNIIMNALKTGSAPEDIAGVLGIDLYRVLEIQSNMLAIDEQ